MSLVDFAYFCGYHGINAVDMPEVATGAAIFSGENDIRAWVGVSTWEEVIALLDQEDPSPEETRQLTCFKQGVAELGMKYLLPKLNTKPSTLGIILSSQAQKYGDSTFNLASPGQIERMQEGYFQAAYALVKEWIPAVHVVPVGVKGE